MNFSTFCVYYIISKILIDINYKYQIINSYTFDYTAWMIEDSPPRALFEKWKWSALQMKFCNATFMASISASQIDLFCPTAV